MKKIFSILLSLALVLSLGVLTAAPAMALSPPEISPMTATYDLDSDSAGNEWWEMGYSQDLSFTIKWNGAATITLVGDNVAPGALVQHVDYEVIGDTLILLDDYLDGRLGGWAGGAGLANPGDQTVVTVVFDDLATTMIDIIITAVANMPTISPASAEFNTYVPADVSTTINWGGATFVASIVQIVAGPPVPLIPWVDYVVIGDTLTILQSWLINPAAGNLTTKDNQVILWITFDIGAQQFVITAVGSENKVNPATVTYDVDDPPTSLTTTVTTDSWVTGINAYWAYPTVADPYYPVLAAGYDYTIAGNTLTITNNYLTNVVAPTAAAGVPIMLEIVFQECNPAFLQIWPVSESPSFLFPDAEFNLDLLATGGDASAYAVLNWGSATSWTITDAQLNCAPFPGIAALEIYDIYSYAAPLGMFVDLIKHSDKDALGVWPQGLEDVLADIGAELVIEYTFDEGTVLDFTITTTGTKPKVSPSSPKFDPLASPTKDVEAWITYGSVATTVIDVLDEDGNSIGGGAWSLGGPIFTPPNTQEKLIIDDAYLTGLGLTVGDEVELTVVFDSDSWAGCVGSLEDDTATLTIEFEGDCATISPDEVEWEEGDGNVCVCVTYEGASNSTVELYNRCGSDDWRDWCPLPSGNWTLTDRCPDPTDCPNEKILCILEEYLIDAFGDEQCADPCVEIAIEFNECFAFLTICPPEEEADGDGAVTCFIATAVYGEDGDATNILREFRDKYLLTNPLGKALVDLYYRVSPPIAEFLTEHPALQPMVRAMLLPAVALSTIAVNTSPAAQIAILALLLASVAVAVWATRRRERGPAYA